MNIKEFEEKYGKKLRAGNPFDGFNTYIVKSSEDRHGEVILERRITDFDYFGCYTHGDPTIRVDFIKVTDELEKDAERVRELNSEEIIEPKKTKANHKAEELEIKTYNLAFSFIETILAKLNKDGVSRYADHIALKLGVADRVAEKLLDVNRYQTIYNFVKLADLAGLEIYITLKDKKTFEVFDYMKISTEIEEE